MNVKPTFVSKSEFNRLWKSLKGRHCKYERPETLGMDVFIYKDGQSNIHLVYKDVEEKIRKKDNRLTIKKVVRHYAFDAYNPNREGKDAFTKVGLKAMKRAKEYCKRYNEDITFKDNKKFVDYMDKNKDIVCSMYHYTNRHIATDTWLKHCYGYDMNSCFPYFLSKPLPYGDIVRQDDIVLDGEVGFNPDLTYENKESLIIAMPGARAKYIFKTKVYQGLTEFANDYYAMKQNAKGSEEYDKIKQELNALVGVMKYTNIFLRAAVLEQARLFMSSLKDCNTIIQTVDSIVSLVPRPDLDLGDKMGQFKLEHKDQSFIFRNDSVKRWAGESTRKTGLRKSREYENFYMITPPYTIDYKEGKIVECDEEWSRLWPEEE